METHDRLLVAIDTMVEERKWVPPKRRGAVCICVRGKRGDDYWVAELGSELRHGFVTGIPPGVEAILLLDEEESRRIVSTGRLPDPAALEVGGDPRLLAELFARYCAYDNMISIRAGRRSAS